MNDIVLPSNLNTAKKDKFLLVFNLPPILKNFNREMSRNNENLSLDSVQTSIFGAISPTITVKATNARFSGSSLYQTSHSKEPFEPVNLKFNIDSGWRNWWTIYQWLNLLHDEKTGQYNSREIIVDGNFSDYQTDLIIYGLDANDRKVIKFTYTKAFPTSLGQIEWNEQESENFELVSDFTFVFTQFHAELIGDNREDFVLE